MISENTLETYCCEDISLIENYEEAVNSPLLYDCHHRNEIDMNKSVKELIDLGLYFNRPTSELIFLEHSEHIRLHNKCRTFSEETKRKISESLKGRTFSDEWRRKLSEASKGENHPMYGKTHSDEVKRKISASRKGKHLVIGEDGKRHWI